MYYSRFADAILQDRLANAGAILIQGAKGCGKTETALQRAKSAVRMDIDEEARLRMELDPKLVLDGQTPRLIDEWQEYPRIWNYVRREVDGRKKKGQFILTGSANPEERARLHSGAGRFSIIKMRPLSSFERKWSSGEVSLSKLVNGAKPKSENVDFTLDDLVGKITLGGWPGLIGADPDTGLRFMEDYISLIAEVDISRAGRKRRDPRRVLRLFKSLARNIATEAALNSLAKDSGGSDASTDDETVAEYLETLERLMVVEQLPAWNPHIRSAAALRKTPKRHFVDPSLAVGALGLSTGKLKADLNYLGFLFESLVIRDIRIYADTKDGKVFHYRDSRDLEADAIVEYPNGTWAAFEVKMAFSAQDEAAANLLKLAARIDTEKMGAPAALTVITANGFACRRKDGVNVAPLYTLTA
jgi:predicted AAA+ superfamily ATPase